MKAKGLLAAVAVALLAGAIAAPSASAKTERVKTKGAVAIYTEGGPRATIQVCDRRRDGAGAVAWLLDNRNRRGFHELVGAVDRTGAFGKCGRIQQLNQVRPYDLVVKVCRHDKSVFGPVEGAFDPTLEDCVHEPV